MRSDDIVDDLHIGTEGTGDLKGGDHVRPSLVMTRPDLWAWFQPILAFQGFFGTDGIASLLESLLQPCSELYFDAGSIACIGSDEIRC